MDDKEIKKIATEKLPTTLTLLIRVLVGGYLLYTDYQLIGSFSKPDITPQEKVFFGVAMLVFFVVGVILIGLSAKYYKEGRYQGGAMDAGEESADIVVDRDVVETDEAEEESLQVNDGAENSDTALLDQTKDIEKTE